MDLMPHLDRFARQFAELEAQGTAGWVVPEAGHAPSLNDAGSLAAIKEFLNEG